MTNYCEVADVELLLGRSLTDDQQAACDAAIAAASAWIDGRGGPWATSDPVADERHRLTDDPALTLYRAPVASVTGITVRTPDVGAASTALTAGTDYELRDAARGVVWLPGYAGYQAYVSYVPNVPLDARIARACALIAAQWLRPALDGVTGDIKSYSQGQELSVTFRDPAGYAVRGVPDEAVTLVDQAVAERSWAAGGF